jgi:predicted O-linked N-acetylglucosamine transferase (SPINDLY family)
MSASLLTHLGLDELISYSLDEYIEKTINIATDKTYYLKIKNKLLNSIKKNNGINSKLFVEELEYKYSKLMNK